jgi:hypothetical protein
MEALLRLSPPWGHRLRVDYGLGTGGWRLAYVVAEMPRWGAPRAVWQQ